MPIDKVQQSFLQQKLHNQQVRQNISHIEQLRQQHNGEQLIQKLQQWHHSPPSLTVTNTLFWTLLSSAVVVALLVVLFALPLYLLIMPAALMIFACVKKENNKQRDQLIQQLCTQHLAEKYHIEFNTHPHGYPIQDLQHHFPLFDLGDYSNEIESTATGVLDSNQKRYPFTLYQYHYVDEVEDRDKDGNITYSYRHYDRWGIFIENMPIQGISISTHQKKACRLGTKWTTSDIRFNQVYELSGNNEMTLARFFNPARILMLEHVLNTLKGDLYFHPNIPVLCWQFSHNIFEAIPHTKGIETTHQLGQLLTQLHMPRFEELAQQLNLFLSKIE